MGRRAEPRRSTRLCEQPELLDTIEHLAVALAPPKRVPLLVTEESVVGAQQAFSVHTRKKHAQSLLKTRISVLNESKAENKVASSDKSEVLKCGVSSSNSKSERAREGAKEGKADLQTAQFYCKAVEQGGRKAGAHLLLQHLTSDKTIHRQHLPRVDFAAIGERLQSNQYCRGGRKHFLRDARAMLSDAIDRFFSIRAISYYSY